MSAKLKLVPTAVAGAIMVRVESCIEDDDGVIIARALNDFSCAVEAMLHGEKVFTDVKGEPFKSHVEIRMKRRHNNYTFYPSSVYSQVESRRVTTFVANLEALVKQLLEFMAEQGKEADKE